VTNFLGPRRFTPNDRFFNLAEYLCVYMDMETYAISASQGLKIHPPGNNFATIICNQFPVEIRHPVFGPFYSAFQPHNVVSYELTIVPARQRNNVLTMESAKWGAIAEMFWNTALVFFYEQHLPWIQSTYGRSARERDQWPAIFRFAWALRNAATHHHGALNITDPMVPPITWHHLKFDHNNAGLRVITDVMSLGDVLLFLIEMSDEFDRRGCPKP
jgi:hypothetical protein